MNIWVLTTYANVASNHTSYTKPSNEATEFNNTDGHSGDLDDVSSICNSRQCVPECKNENKPFIGQCFSTLEQGICFYNEYARICGFDVRRGTEKSKKGIIILKHLVCNREGLNEIDKKIVTANNEEEGSIMRGSRKRTVSRRCGCKAMIGLKLKGEHCYMVYVFVEHHNHELATLEGRQFLMSNRIMSYEQKRFVFDASKVQIGASKAHHLMKELTGGFEKVGATVTEFRNFNRDLKQSIGDRDAQIILDKLKAKNDAHSGFYYEFDVDITGHLTKLFWADPVGRRNYDLFGDVISFDATFGTNKYNMVFVPFCGVDNHRKCVTFAAGLLSREDIVHYTWVFRAFLKAMRREPLCILTDQCPAMKQAVPTVFATARHRLCMWHIMKKLSTKVGPVMCKDGEFMSKIKQFVWGENLDVTEFEQGWQQVIEEFGLMDNEWLSEMYEMREYWIPAYFRDDPLLGILRTTSWSESANAFFGKFNMHRDTLTEFFMRFETAMDKQRNVNARLNDECLTSLPKMETPLVIEKHAAEVYTREIFYRVQYQIKQACYNLSIKSMSSDAGVMSILIKDPKDKDKEFKVTYIQENMFIQCSCQLFERVGIICSHAILALKHSNVYKIPQHLILNRWCKNAEMTVSSLFPVILEECNTIEKERAKLNDISMDFNVCMGLLASNNEDIDYAAAVVKDLKHHLRARRGTNVNTSKKDIIQNIICSEIPENITVMPPNESRNKGCGKKRIVGEVEKAIQRSEKPKRLCRACNQMSNHDKRNCPSLNKEND